MKKLSYIISIVTINLLLVTNTTSCKKLISPEPDNEELPPITTEGKNTFGCLVNGEVMATPFTNLSDLKVYYHFLKNEPNLLGTSLIRALKKRGVERNWRVEIGSTQSLFKTGEYTLGDKDSANQIKGEALFSILPNSGPGLVEYRTSSNLYTQFNITKLDTINRIISGTFEFDAVNEKDDTDTVKIRQGRFDCKFLY